MCFFHEFPLWLLTLLEVDMKQAHERCNNFPETLWAALLMVFFHLFNECGLHWKENTTPAILYIFTCFDIRFAIHCQANVFAGKCIFTSNTSNSHGAKITIKLTLWTVCYTKQCGEAIFGKKSDLAGDWTYHPKASWLIKPKLVERRARKHLSTKKSLLCHSLLLCKWCYSTYGNLLRSCHCYFQTNRHFCYQSYSCVPPEERMSGKMLILWTQLRCKVYAINPLDLSPVFTVLLTIVWFAPVVGWYHIFWFQSYSE